MANKYSKLSDFEVNILIINSLHPNNHYQFSKYPDESTACYWVGDGHNGYELLDCCQNYPEAMHLMIDNKINLAFNPLVNQWVAEVHDKHDVLTFNNNPCRAIAECFLLMKDAGVSHG